MTLITYLSRVHFADGVLEEALRSELEVNGHRRPFVISEEDALESEFCERLYAGFPMRSRPIHYAVPKNAGKYRVAAEVTDMFADHDADVLVAYGSAAAIAIARKCRQTISQHRLETATDTTRPSLPDLFVVPGIDGLPDPCRTSRERLGATVRKTRPPSVVICDPTLTLGADPSVSASAAVNAMIRCIEALLSPAYNPPADGIALDGLGRSAKYLRLVLNRDTLEIRRELMAAGLNGALAQQKGTGTAQALGEALSTAARIELDQGALKRLLLPGLLALRDANDPRLERVRGGLGIADLATGIENLFGDLPLPDSLSGLGVAHHDLAPAARDVVGSVDVAAPTEDKLMSIMEAVYSAGSDGP